MTQGNDDDLELVRQARDGNSTALGALLARHHERLDRMVRLRLDPRIQGRVSSSDVLQETYLDAARRIHEYLENPQVPFFIWLRFLTGQSLAQAHRRHLGTKARDAAREASSRPQAGPAVATDHLADQLIGDLTSPSLAALRKEVRQCLIESLDRMQPLDREVLVLRHFEQLTNAEAARVLELSPTAASNRYVRALERLREILAEIPEFHPEP